jgi:proteic killer suppression protein
MIKSVRHKGLRRFYETGDIRGIDARHVAWLRVLLTALDTARGPALGSIS